MKRTFLFLLICLFINTSYSQTYNFEFSISDFSIIENNGKHLINHPIHFDAISNTCDPILPSCVKKILLPPNKKVSNYSVTYTLTNWQTNIELKAMPMMHPTDGNYYPDMPCSYELKIYPDSVVRYGGIATIDHYNYVNFVITPFLYNATNGLLSFINQVSINIELTDDEISNNIPTQSSVIKRIVHNPNDVDLYYPKKSSKSTIQDIDYLIITADSLKNSFEPLRIWKTQKGVYTKIITLSEIYSNYIGESPQLKIKQCIKDYYDNRGLKWVLLGGDDSVVPIVKAYSQLLAQKADTSETYLKSELIPTDLFYACFNGTFNWDANENDTIGELRDNIGINQVVNISRLPIRTKQQINMYTDKLLNYELNPPISNPSMLVCAQKLWNYDTITPYYSDAHLKSDIFINNHISPHWNGNITRFYDTGTDFPGGANYDLTRENIITQLNSNYNFLHFATHGGPIQWRIENNSSFYASNVRLLTNSYPTIVVTMSCSTNAFDEAEPCLSEAFIRHPTGGAVAYFGSSREGWGKEDFYLLGSSFNFSAHFFKNLFNGVSYNFSKIVRLIKSHYSGNINSYNSYRWILFSNNAIGDAELPIYTTTPNKFENITLEYNGSNLTINTNGIDSCTITLSNNIGNDEEYYSTYTNVSSTTFNNVPAEYTIVITKDNYIPYIIKKDCHLTGGTIDIHKVIAGCTRTKIGGMPNFADNIMQTNNTTTSIPEIDAPANPPSVWQVKITPTGSLEVLNGGIVIINYLSMEDGGELYIH